MKQAEDFTHFFVENAKKMTVAIWNVAILVLLNKSAVRNNVISWDFGLKKRQLTF